MARERPTAEELPDPFRGRAWLVPLLAAAVCAAVFHRFFAHVLIFRDGLQLVAPYKRWIADGLSNGTVHGWYPWSLLGVPFVASIEAGSYYPLNVLYVFLPFGAAHNLFILAHYPLAAWLMTVFLRGRGVAGWPSVLGGLGYALSGHLLSQHATVMPLVGAAWAPLALHAFGRALTGSLRWASGCGAALALPLLGGDPMGAGTTALILAAWGTVSALDGSRRRRALVGLAVGAASAAILAAAQILPTAELARLSVRRGGLGLDEAQIFSLHPAQLVDLIWPSPFGVLFPERTFWGAFLLDGPYDNPWSITSYLGLPVVALAVFGFARSRRGAFRLGTLAATVVFLLLALGRYTPLYAACHAVVPLFDLFRYPAKYLTGVSGGLAIGAALGFEAIAERIETAGKGYSRAAVVFAAAAAGGLVLSIPAWIGTLDAHVEAGPAREGAALVVLRGGIEVLLVSAAAATLLWLAATRRLTSRGAAPAFLALLVIDWTVASARTIPAGPAGFFRERPAAASLLEPVPPPRPGAYRIFRESVPFRDTNPAAAPELLTRQRLWERDTLFRNLDAMEGFEDVVGYSASQLIEGLSLLKRNLTPPVLERLNVRYVLAPYEREQLKSAASRVVQRDPRLDLAILELPNAFPRAYWVAGAQKAASEEEAIALLKSPGTADVVILDPAAPQPPPAPAGIPRRPATIREHSPDRVVVEVESDRSGWLVLSDRHYPGWRADVDGRPARIERANVLVRAVPVPPGRHTVTFRFVSTPLRAGAAISLLGWAGAAAWWLTALARSRRRPAAA